MQSQHGSLPKRLSLSLCFLALPLLGQMASAQSSLFSESLVAVNNIGSQFAYLDFQAASDNSIVSAGSTQSFTGKDGAGNTQTMTFTGSTVSQSNYGRLHVLTQGSLKNSYYNANNSDYAGTNGEVVDPAGSPSTFSCLGFAIFNDTLHYGGALESGYKARYIFHVDGTNSGTGVVADLGVNVDQNPGDAFFAFDSGFYSANWATNTFDVNGITPQKINVQFSDQVVFNAYDLTDGQDYSGTSDFFSTLTLTAIEVVDKNGNLASGWTVTSDSGTQYPTHQGNQAVPEPGSITLLLGLGMMGAGYLRRRRQ